jgi:hypothetical protein
LNGLTASGNLPEAPTIAFGFPVGEPTQPAEFEPRIDDALRTQLLDGWNRAVRTALAWAGE